MSDAAAVVVGQLGDADRRRALAAVELGAETLDDVVTVTAMTAAAAERAVTRLLAAGVLIAHDGNLAVNTAAFHDAARQLLARPARTEHDDAPAPARSVLNAFVHDGRLTAMPVAPGKQRIVLEWLAARIEPGRHYREAEINELLDGHAIDVARLRRALVDAQLLDRADGEYWRCGGSVE